MWHRRPRVKMAARYPPLWTTWKKMAPNSIPRWPDSFFTSCPDTDRRDPVIDTHSNSWTGYNAIEYNWKNCKLAMIKKTNKVILCGAVNDFLQERHLLGSSWKPIRTCSLKLSTGSGFIGWRNRFHGTDSWAGIFKKSMGARHRGGIGFSYRPAMLHRLAEFIPCNQFRGPININININGLWAH